MEPRPAVLALACAGVLGVTLVAQDPGGRGRVEQVRVEVRVTDNRQNPVTDLQASDFEITDDDQRQAIVTFIPPGRGQGSTTAAPAAPPAGAPAPVSQEDPAPAAAGRPVVIVLDDLHVAAPNTLKVADSVRSFISTVLSPADSVAVVVTSGAGGGQDFTADRRLVLKAIDRFRGQKLRSATVERLNDPILNFGGVIQPNADGNKPERANRARIALETLQKIGDALAPFEDRRPMVLWVSEGPEYEVTDFPERNESNQWSISRGLRGAIERLNRVNGVLYAIDPRGVSAGNADQIQTSTIFEMYRSVGSAALRNEEVRAFGVIQAVATNTGGFAMLWRPNMSADFRRVAGANEAYYLIGYDAPAVNRGKYHAIVVRVRRPGVQVRARTGYFLPAVDASAKPQGLAQEQPAALPVDAAFEVTSVKRVTDPTAQVSARSSNNGRLSAVFTVRTLVSLAYGYPDTLRDDQVVGGPSWINTDLFEINATFEGPIAIAPNSPPVRLLAMERRLLADRFQLKVHQETRPLRVFDLVVSRDDGRLGPRLKQSDGSCAPSCGVKRSVAGGMSAKGIPLSRFALLISFLPDVQRVVRDRTGLTGAFDLDIDFARSETADPQEHPPLMTALKEQLGLELRATTAPANVIVIDHVEPPLPD